MNNTVRSIVAFAILCVLGAVQQGFLPFEHWQNVILPLFVTYIILGMSIGNQNDKDIQESISSGVITGMSVYILIYIWLYSVGFFKGTGGMAFIQFLVSVFVVTITSVITREIKNHT
jgi:hypothetical protein